MFQEHVLSISWPSVTEASALYRAFVELKKEMQLNLRSVTDVVGFSG